MEDKETRQFEGVEYSLIRRRGQRSLRMHFKDNGALVVSVPYFTPQNIVDSFLQKNAGWIAKHGASVPQHSYSTWDSVPFLGKDCKLLVIKGSPASSSYLEGEILITVPHPDKPETVKKQLYLLYGNTLLSYASKHAPYWAGLIGVSVPSFSVNNAKTRWGSCSFTKRAVTLSAITAALPEDLIEMVLVHELCHLVHPDHQKGFHTLLGSLIPDINDREKRLKAITRTNVCRNLF